MAGALPMVFSSPVFLFLFLPLTLGTYFLCPRPLKNLWLLLASLLFYSWGEPALVLVMIASIAMNYVLGLGIEFARPRGLAQGVVLLAVVLNLGLLIHFKYVEFFVENINSLLISFDVRPIKVKDVVMPIGISFFTFQAMSYVIDVYRRTGQVERNPINMGLYIALFPQLIAGPIVRYHDVAAQIVHRAVSREGFAEGVRRFVLGLGKKVLIANTVAVTADAVFEIPNHQLSASMAWLGILCYTLQIYFDFSGYSDMAIGLGRMFGFCFLENFNYPYIAGSITDFWRRWHISLSSWFREYLYIPLGGNRRGPLRTYLNLLTVFFLCGLWHGASWNFVIWGLFHGSFLVIERRGLLSALERCWVPLRHTYVLLTVMVGWIFFRAVDVAHAWAFLSAMAGGGGATTTEYHVGLYLNPGVMLAIVCGCLGAMPLLPAWTNWTTKLAESRPATLLRLWWLDAIHRFAGVVALGMVLLASMAQLAASTYNPFIYFRF